jgi:predicted amidohydrolase YtcJ
MTPPAGVDAYDARGRLIVPGFIDGHAHLLGTGVAMRSVALKDVASADEAARLVGERARVAPEGAWIEGAGWDQHPWPGGAFPTRQQLDTVAPRQPVVLVHTSGHCAWVNSAALQAAGIDATTEAPAGGAIERDEAGEPTGILLDEAQRLVRTAMPPPSPETRRAAIQEAIAYAHSLGITCVHAMDIGRGELAAIESLHSDGRLSLRVRAYLSARRLDDWTGTRRTGDGNSTLCIGGVKFFADGALGPLTAWLWEPYEGSQDTGLALLPPDDLEARVRRCLEHGLAPTVHAIGDRANTEVLNIFQRMGGLAPDLPRRIEHTQLLQPEDIARFGTLGVVASVQPIHATQDMHKVDRYWGTRGRGAYAFELLRATGATLAFGSDSPVETMDPIAGLHAAVTRRNALGDPPSGWYPDERLSLEASLTAYTGGCARAAGEETSVGRIAPGYHADVAVVSRDLFVLDDPMELLDARVEMTVVGGAVVYRRD